jgi:hypothetical protein
LDPVDGVTSNPVMSGFASAKRYVVGGAAMQYVFGKITLGVNYTNIGFQDLNYSLSGDLSKTNPRGYSGTASFKSYGAYGQYYIFLGSSSIFQLRAARARYYLWS